MMRFRASQASSTPAQHPAPPAPPARASRATRALRAAATLLAATLLVGLCGCSAGGSGSGSSSTTIAGANESIVPAYEHYDPTNLNQLCDQLISAAGGESANEALDLYDQALAQVEYLATLDTVSYVKYCENVSDDSLEEEYSYTDNLVVECSDRFFQAASVLATSAHADAFKAHVNNDTLFEALCTYVAMTPEEIALTERETELSNQYYEIIDNAGDYTYEYDGRSYTLDALESEMSLAALGEQGYLDVYGGCMQKVNEAAGAVFTELVSVRTQIAQLNGYADYCEYADVELYCRDYTEEDLDSFRTAVRTFSASGAAPDPYDLVSALPDYTVSTKTLLNDVATAVTPVSSYATEALQYLRENGLSSIGPDDTRLEAGYTTDLYKPARSAFVFYHTSGDINDLCGLVHELGHFTNATRCGTDFLSLSASGSCLDVCEVHSTGLELLAGKQMGSVIDQSSAETISAWLAAFAVQSVSDGCIYDEWQRTVYRNPTMSLDQINEAFRSTLGAYGMDTSDVSTYGWVMVSHNFDAPLYYVSYATSYFASLQLWDKADTDASGAAAIWEKAVDCAPNTGYLELCSSVGLASMADQNAVTQTLSSISAKINQVVATVSAGSNA